MTQALPLQCFTGFPLLRKVERDKPSERRSPLDGSILLTLKTKPLIGTQSDLLDFVTLERLINPSSLLADVVLEIKMFLRNTFA